MRGAFPFRLLHTILLLAGVAGVVSLNRTVDPDLFWHLRAAQDILREGRIVLPDSWNYLFHGRPWVNQQWLSQLAFLAAWSGGGFLGLALLRGALVAGTVALMWRSMSTTSPAGRALSAALFLGASEQFLIARTHLFSLLALAALLCLLKTMGDRGRLFTLPALFALWANLHAFFGVGLAVLGLYLAAEWVAASRGSSEDQRAQGGVKAVLPKVLLLSACAVATLLNPFGAGVWQTAFSVAASAETQMVSEWQPLWNYSFWANLPLYVVAVPFLVMLVRNRREVRWPTATGGVLLLGLSVLAVRFTPPFALLAIASCGSPIENGLLAAGPVRSRWVGALGSVGAVAVVAAALNLALLSPQCIPGSCPLEQQVLEYPVAAVSWMRQQGLSGRVFNSHNWGGYLAWAHPGCQTAIDPRTGVLLYPPGYFAHWAQTVDLGPKWKELLSEGDPQFALLKAGTLLPSQLSQDPAWRLVYEDRVAVLYERRSYH